MRDPLGYIIIRIGGSANYSWNLYCKKLQGVQKKKKSHQVLLRLMKTGRRGL